MLMEPIMSKAKTDNDNVMQHEQSKRRSIYIYFIYNMLYIYILYIICYIYIYIFIHLIIVNIRET